MIDARASLSDGRREFELRELLCGHSLENTFRVEIGQAGEMIAQREKCIAIPVKKI